MLLKPWNRSCFLPEINLNVLRTGAFPSFPASATYVLGKPHLFESLICFHLPASLPACGGTLRGESGTFTTPYYPAHYPPATDCVWNIEVRHILLLALNIVSNKPAYMGQSASEFTEGTA